MSREAIAGAVLAALVLFVLGLWLGGGSRRVGEGGAWREPYEAEPDFV